jgi:hypothetical protein
MRRICFASSRLYASASGGKLLKVGLVFVHADLLQEATRIFERKTKDSVANFCCVPSHLIMIILTRLFQQGRNFGFAFTVIFELLRNECVIRCHLVNQVRFFLSGELIVAGL